MRIPTDEEIRALHKEYAPTRRAFDLIYTHSNIVCALAEEVVDRRQLTLDIDLVRAGSLLHDIGVYRLYGPSGEIDHASYVRHGVLGYELLHSLGFPDAVCRFCSCHIGMGLSREDVIMQGLPLPVDDYLATNREEELVMFADKFHSKTTPPAFLTASSYAWKARHFGEDKVAAFTSMLERFGEPDLGPLLKAYGHGLVRGEPS
jgi:uncharacterized protein